jgi:hypothetical protein
VRRPKPQTLGWDGPHTGRPVGVSDGSNTRGGHWMVPPSARHESGSTRGFLTRFWLDQVEGGIPQLPEPTRPNRIQQVC